MKLPDYAPFPWRMEVLVPGHIAIIAADGGVLLSDETGEGDVAAALYAVHAANAYAGLVETGQTLLGRFDGASSFGLGSFDIERELRALRAAIKVASGEQET
jgi:hypothetical protein